MQSVMKILLGAGVTAASMYYLDPSRGQDRRAEARARLEHGKDAVAQGVHKASSGFDSASRHARVAGHRLGQETGKFSHGARNLAAGAAGTAVSFLNRNRSHGRTRAALRDAPRGKFLLIPGAWIATIGLGAAAMYYLDSSQGESRRARLVRPARRLARRGAREDERDWPEVAGQSSGNHRRIHGSNDWKRVRSLPKAG